MTTYERQLSLGVILILVYLVLAASCVPSEPTATPTANPTATPVPSTPTPTAEQTDPTILTPTVISEVPTPTLIDQPVLFGEVTFDGSGCTVEGPDEVERGAYYFVLNDMSDRDLQLWVNQILDGKQFEDLLDWQGEPGEYRPPPSWIEHPRSTYSMDVKTMVHLLDQVGDYAILVGGYHPSSLWFCEPFRVVGVESD